VSLYGAERFFEGAAGEVDGTARNEDVVAAVFATLREELLAEDIEEADVLLLSACCCGAAARPEGSPPPSTLNTAVSPG
jgi:hypothetical protein